MSDESDALRLTGDGVLEAIDACEDFAVGQDEHGRLVADETLNVLAVAALRALSRALVLEGMTDEEARRQGVWALEKAAEDRRDQACIWDEGNDPGADLDKAARVLRATLTGRSGE